MAPQDQHGINSVLVQPCQSCPQEHSLLRILIWGKWACHQYRMSKLVLNHTVFSHLEKLAVLEIVMPPSALLEGSQQLGRTLLGKERSG